MSRRRTYVIAYDIADPRRLARVHRFLKQFAFPVQYSVFLGTFTDTALNAILEGLATIIHPRQDDVRAYPLPAAPRIESLGRPVLPEGVVPGEGSVVGLGRWHEALAGGDAESTDAEANAPHHGDDGDDEDADDHDDDEDDDPEGGDDDGHA